MCNTIPLRCANPRCPQIILYRPAASSKCYCDHADCQRLRAAERQRRHYREVATTPSRRPEHEAMLARKTGVRRDGRRARDISGHVYVWLFGGRVRS